FFSSRRPHTRSKRDWSSDVCSSDLARSSTNLIYMLKIYLKCWQQISVYNKRSGRKEFWLFLLFNIFIFFACTVFDLVLNTDLFFKLYGIYALLMFFPGVSLIFRRLNDIEKIHWLAILMVIPLANIYLFWFLLLYDSILDFYLFVI